MQGRGRSDCEAGGVAKEEKRRKGGRNLDRQRGLELGGNTEYVRWVIANMMG